MSSLSDQTNKEKNHQKPRTDELIDNLNFCINKILMEKSEKSMNGNV